VTDRLYIGHPDCESLPLTAKAVQLGDYISSRLNWRASGKVTWILTGLRSRILVWQVETPTGAVAYVMEGDVYVPGYSPTIEF